MNRQTHGKIQSGLRRIVKTFEGRLTLVLRHPAFSEMTHARLYDLEDLGNVLRIKP